MNDRDDDYREDTRDERADRRRRDAWEYAGPGWIKADDLEEQENDSN